MSGSQPLSRISEEVEVPDHAADLMGKINKTVESFFAATWTDIFQQAKLKRFSSGDIVILRNLYSVKHAEFEPGAN